MAGGTGKWWRGLLLAVICLGIGTYGRADTAIINATDEIFKSTGGTSGSNYNLWSNGYTGSFLYLAAPGTVTLSVMAKGSVAAGVWPQMDLHVGDQKAAWTVGSSSYQNYSASFQLPAGTFFVRTEFNNDLNAPPEDRNLYLQTVTASSAANLGMSWQNNSDTATINAEADTYIENYRKSSAQVSLTRADGSALPDGVQVQLKLRSHAFNFGTAVGGTTIANSHLSLNPAPGTTDYQYQQALVQNFNTLVPENGGKWSYNEATRDVVTMDYVDRLNSFAQANGMRMRMHNVAWGQSQPTWVNSLLASASAGNTAAKADLSSALTSRIGYYIADRANNYAEIDGVNESYHQSVYLNIYGASGLADLYNQMIDAARNAGSNAKVYFNEYNVLSDGSYANWYRGHIQSILDGGITTQNRDRLGIGVQCHTSASFDPVKTFKNLQNLTGFEMPITLSEFSVSDSDTLSAPQILEDALRLTFGNDQATSFMMWDFWQSQMWHHGAALFDANWNITPAGKVWQQMTGIKDWGLAGVPYWTTDLTLATDAAGRVSFNGFLGDYDVTVGNSPVTMKLVAGSGGYQVSVPLADRLWTGSAGLTWSSTANWTGGHVPSANGERAHFGTPAGPQPQLDTSVTLGQVVFDQPGWTIGGSGTLTLDAATIANDAAVYSNGSGTNAITAAIALRGSNSFSPAAGNLLVLGNVTDAADAVGQLVKTGGGTLFLSGSNTYSGDTTVNGGALKAYAISGTGNTTIAGGASLQVNYIRQHELTIAAGGTLVLGGVLAPAGAPSQGDTLSFAATPAVLDIAPAAPRELGQSPPNVIPEPSTWVLLVSALWMLLPLLRRCRDRRKE